jgi:hypothetical protein
MIIKKRIIFSADWLILLLLLVVPCTASAEARTKGVDPSRKEELFCRQIQDKITDKQEIRTVVKTGIQMGYDSCRVIKCSVRGGGDLNQIIGGAVEAGISNDIISKCCLDACVEMKEKQAGGISGSIEPYWKKQTADDGICREISEEISRKKEIRQIVSAILRKGSNICNTLYCALKSSGDTDQIIAGAMDAGYHKDTLSRCFFQSCAKDISAVLNMISDQTCYIFPEDFDPGPPIPPGPPLSPSSF